MRSINALSCAWAARIVIGGRPRFARVVEEENECRRKSCRGDTLLRTCPISKHNSRRLGGVNESYSYDGSPFVRTSPRVPLPEVAVAVEGMVPAAERTLCPRCDVVGTGSAPFFLLSRLPLRFVFVVLFVSNPLALECTSDNSVFLFRGDDDDDASNLTDVDPELLRYTLQDASMFVGKTA